MQFFGAVEADFLREYRQDLFSLLNDPDFTFRHFIRLTMNLSQDSEFKRHIREMNEQNNKVAAVHAGHGEVNVINDPLTAEEIFKRM